ncbi:MAG: hypothetical protein JKY25_02430 [Robiginitomaculum sp.]|nr:hypothetical protein [Robiginitomaculum sp.]
MERPEYVADEHLDYLNSLGVEDASAESAWERVHDAFYVTSDQAKEIAKYWLEALRGAR